jgi:hypothetical protein
MDRVGGFEPTTSATAARGFSTCLKAADYAISMQKKEQQLQKSLTHCFSIFISASHAKFFFIVVKLLLLRLALIF